VSTTPEQRLIRVMAEGFNRVLKMFARDDSMNLQAQVAAMSVSSPADQPSSRLRQIHKDANGSHRQGSGESKYHTFNNKMWYP